MVSINSFSYTYEEPLLEAKVAMDGSKGYFVLSGKCFEVNAFQPRWRSISEWWNGKKITPASMEVDPKSWSLNSKIDVYVLDGGDHFFNLSDASNQKVLKECTHALVNHHTGKVLYARAMRVSECVKAAFDAGHKAGKIAGYQDGYRNGQSMGYSSGYRQAKQLMQEEGEKAIQEAYLKGLKNGKESSQIEITIK